MDTRHLFYNFRRLNNTELFEGTGKYETKARKKKFQNLNLVNVSVIANVLYLINKQYVNMHAYTLSRHPLTWTLYFASESLACEALHNAH